MNSPADEHLDSLLSRAAEELEPCPPELVGRIAGQLRRRRLRRAAAGAALAAAMLLLAGSYLFWPDTRVAQQHDQRPAPSDPADDSAPPRESRLVGATAMPSEPPEPESDDVDIRLADGFIGEPLSSDNPRITILWVYPASRSDDTEDFPESRSMSPTTLETRVAKSTVGRDRAGSIVD